MQTQIKSASLTITLSPFGGQLTSIKDTKGTEYLWQGNPTYWSGQAPILFPIVGSLRNNTGTTQSGKVLSMSRHGVAKKCDFALSSQSDSTAVYSLQANEETLAAYPFQFALEQRYSVSDNTITVEYMVRNRGEEPMPFQIGAHPGFNCPLFDGEDFSDYRVVFPQKETVRAPLLTPDGLVDVSQTNFTFDNADTIQLQHSLFYKDAIALPHLKSDSVSLLNREGHGVQLDFPGFDYLLLWSAKNDAPFLCLEPWTGLATCTDESDIFETKRGVHILAPHGARSFSYTITVV